MFSVTVIKLKDIVKIGIILFLIYVFCKLIFNDNLKNRLNYMFDLNNGELVKVGINSELNFIKIISEEDENNIDEKTEEIEESDDIAFSKSILKFGSNIFYAKQIEIDDGQDNDEVVNISQSYELAPENINSDVSTDVTTQVITKNPIAENYNVDYKGVKIKNGTDFELTDDILNPDLLEINKQNIVIFHTHTCESYTQTENESYEPSR